MTNEGFKTYLFSYNYAGAQWGFEIKAKNPDEAKERVNRLMFATFDGEAVAKLPVELGLLARIIIRLRNSYQAISRL